jgi:hypothetical protein
MEERFSAGKARETGWTGTGSNRDGYIPTAGLRPGRFGEASVSKTPCRTGFGPGDRRAPALQSDGLTPDRTASEAHPSDATGDLRVIRSSK